MTDENGKWKGEFVNKTLPHFTSAFNGGLEIVQEITVEIEGENKPALVAEWITRSVFA